MDNVFARELYNLLLWNRGTLCAGMSPSSRGSFLYFKNIELGNLKSFYTSLLITLLLPVVLQTLVCALVVLWGVSAFGSSLMRFDNFLKFEDNTISFCDWFHKRKQYSLCGTHTSFLKPHNVKKRNVLCGYEKVVGSHSMF
jgi:hypothetical protein